MTPDPVIVAGAILAKASTVDPTIPRADRAVLAGWAEILEPHDIAMDEALTAVAEHYGKTTKRIMPADVVALVKAARTTQRPRRSLSAQQALTGPSPFQYDPERAQRAQRHIPAIRDELARRRANRAPTPKADTA